MYNKFCYQASDADEEYDFCVDGIRGKILLSKDVVGHLGTVLSPLRSLPPVQENSVFSARFRDLTYAADFIFKANRLVHEFELFSVFSKAFEIFIKG